MGFTWTIVALVVVMAIAWRFLGSYMAAVFEGRVRWLSAVERPIYRAIGVDPGSEQSWQRYGASLIIFSAVALAFTYLIFRLQGVLPLNPQHLPAVSPALAWNTSVSFVTNTNWQAYSGETTMSYLSQMGALAVQNFVSAAVGIAVAVALIRGFARKGARSIGNFWADLVRGLIYVLLPIALVATIVFMAQGALETLAGPAHIHDALNGASQVIPRGPVASQETIKQLGTNGGGFFNANGADPFENPTGLTNFLSIALILCIPVGLTYTFGKRGSLPRVLIVDDDPDLLSVCRVGLTALGHEVQTAETGADGLSAAAIGRPDVIVLDLGLPDLDGMEVCKRVRSWTDVPIIVLSADSTEDRKVEALEGGADDYITKPFGMRELGARLQVALRHHASANGASEPSELTVGPLHLDLVHYQATYEGREVPLTAREFEFLAYLARSAGKICTRRMILENVWGPGYVREVNYLKVYAYRIRRKLGDEDGSFLQSDPSLGYRLMVPEPS